MPSNAELQTLVTAQAGQLQAMQALLAAHGIVAPAAPADEDDESTEEEDGLQRPKLEPPKEQFSGDRSKWEGRQ